MRILVDPSDPDWPGEKYTGVANVCKYFMTACGVSDLKALSTANHSSYVLKCLEWMHGSMWDNIDSNKKCYTCLEKNHRHAMRYLVCMLFVCWLGYFVNNLLKHVVYIIFIYI